MASIAERCVPLVSKFLTIEDPEQLYDPVISHIFAIVDFCVVKAIQKEADHLSGAFAFFVPETKKPVEINQQASRWSSKRTADTTKAIVLQERLHRHRSMPATSCTDSAHLDRSEAQTRSCWQQRTEI